jgi:phosphoribosylaminoimidazole-succinocarboxamide synthase
MADEAALIDSNIPDLKLLSKGKVRDIYATSSPDHLLFVASDRISAYDVILKNVNSSLVHFYLTMMTTIVFPVVRAFRTRAVS